MQVLEGKAWLQLIDTSAKKKKERDVKNIFNVAPMFQRIALQINHINAKGIYLVRSIYV